MSYFRRKVGRLLRGTDVRINGNRPWDIRVHDNRFFRRVLGGASLALGETYMNGLWDCDALDEAQEAKLDLICRKQGAS